MRRNSPLLVVAVVAALLSPAAAPGAEPQAAQTKPQGEPPAAGDLAPSDASLRRIRRLLRESPPATREGASSLLRLEYYIQVVGQAPRVDFFKDFKIGPATAVQYGPMTHAEFLRMAAPPWRKWQ